MKNEESQIGIKMTEALATESQVTESTLGIKMGESLLTDPR
jgi:hypothetical protein